MRRLSMVLVLLLSGCSVPSTTSIPESQTTQTQSPQQATEVIEDPDSSSLELKEDADTQESDSDLVTVGEDVQMTENQGEAHGEPSTEATAGNSSDLINQLPAEANLAELKVHVRKLDDFAKSQEPFPVKFTMGPTAVPAKVESVIARFSEKMKMYQLVGLSGLDMDWVLASEQDYAWWVEYRSSQESNYPLDLWNPDANELGHCRLSADIFCGAGNTVNGTKYQDNIVGTKFTNRGLDYVSRHEAAHFYQSVFGYGGRCWWAEGQATFFETYLETTSRNRTQVLDRLKVSPAGVVLLSEEDLIRKMQNNSICDKDPDVAYDLGMLAFEYLYMHFSFQQVHDLMVRSSNQAWSSSVASLLGLDGDELDRSIGEYVFASLHP